ncbi:unnamed protein product [Diabrotica balteata]|uniref:Uncharacterized protein n=1 Tax=Diabrotica balteata TaxID=107213 RepID=A0A9N9SUH7_DIABA|nr:unnamed protein product [Diabrotica balteata]
MEVKQEFSEDICKIEIFSNEVDGALLDSFKSEEKLIKESAHGSFDYLDLKEFPLKTEIKNESELEPLEEKEIVKRKVFTQTDLIFNVVQNRLTDSIHSKNRITKLVQNIRDFRNDSNFQ